MLFDLAVGRVKPIPFYGELGSVNPVFVTKGAAQSRLEEILSGYVTSFSLGAGQFCTCLLYTSLQGRGTADREGDRRGAGHLEDSCARRPQGTERDRARDLEQSPGYLGEGSRRFHGSVCVLSLIHI